MRCSLLCAAVDAAWSCVRTESRSQESKAAPQSQRASNTASIEEEEEEEEAAA